MVKKARLTKVAFNPRWPILLVGDDKGGVTSLKLSPNTRLRCVPDKGQKETAEELEVRVPLLVLLLLFSLLLFVFGRSWRWVLVVGEGYGRRLWGRGVRMVVVGVPWECACSLMWEGGGGGSHSGAYVATHIQEAGRRLCPSLHPYPTLPRVPKVTVDAGVDFVHASCSIYSHTFALLVKTIHTAS